MFEGKPSVAKRVRTKQRFEEFYRLALACHQQNWSHSKALTEAEHLITKNFDLQDEKAKNTARDEFIAMIHTSINMWLQKIREISERKLETEPPATKLRLNHVFIQLCRKAAKYQGGPGPIVREFEAGL